MLTRRGETVRQILQLDHDLFSEVMHYLHYDRYDGSPSARKLFWSYRTCCHIAWERKQVPPSQDLASEVQALIAAEFPAAYARRIGGNFNKGGVDSGWRPWLARLAPAAFADGGAVVPRVSGRFELALLALDHVYRDRGYRYGDPVILDDRMLDAVARVFFLDVTCCRELIDLSARLTRRIELSDTFAGTSVSLLAPYGIERI